MKFSSPIFAIFAPFCGQESSVFSVYSVVNQKEK